MLPQHTYPHTPTLHTALSLQLAHTITTMPFRFTNVHMAAPATPAAIDPWARPAKASAKAVKVRVPKSKRPAVAASPVIVRPPPRSSSLRPQQMVKAAHAGVSQVTLVPLSVAQKRSDIKYRMEAYEVEERRRDRFALQTGRPDPHCTHTDPRPWIATGTTGPGGVGPALSGSEVRRQNALPFRGPRDKYPVEAKRLTGETNMRMFSNG
ncbi:hypothetical protein PHLGIDRAFT_510661 [Phlebiopsis gigantea 11061_1 CR5-6]|uniref:Uncharacterized protein n=1 Tax=Phlebiopsis gigantea (strain 11061_1 CR5-6) TaxID=745531 RepID=A0A0C3NS13_PHLG1|nr:hypothetical protein PHLGIDRAFT_510661 [Phlebiopsis gigantea 11061_1 CR5-6]